MSQRLSIDLLAPSPPTQGEWVPLGQHLDMRRIAAETADIPHLGLVPVSRIRLRPRQPQPAPALPLYPLGPPRPVRRAQPPKKKPTPSLWSWIAKWM